jgi:hypothetical protein
MGQTEICKTPNNNTSTQKKTGLTIELPENIVSNINTVDHFKCYLEIEKTRIRKKYYVPIKWSVDKFIRAMKICVMQDFGEHLEPYNDLQFVIKNQQRNSHEKFDHVLTGDLIYYVNELDMRHVYIRRDI